MRTKNKKITVTVDASTWRWLRALARANQKSDMRLAPSTPEGILAQAAFCFADAAGRRTGSWEASVGQSLLDSSGYQKSVGLPDYDLCSRHDEREHAAWRADQDANQAMDRLAAADKCPDCFMGVVPVFHGDITSEKPCPACSAALAGERLFRKIGGFPSYSTTLFVEVPADGSQTTKLHLKDGRIFPTEYYPINECLELVDRGVWEEITGLNKQAGEFAQEWRDIDDKKPEPSTQ